MNRSSSTAIAIAGLLLAVMSGATWAAQDRYTLKAANGVAFSEFRGYENWPVVAVSQVEDGLKVIQANDTMIKAYRAGAPGNHKAFPEGSAIVKIEWSPRKNEQSPYFAMEPDKLMSVSFIQKDTKRFPDTNGWGYAQFLYDAKTDSFKPFGEDASFNKDVCHACHIRVASRDYIYTSYPKR